MLCLKCFQYSVPMLIVLGLPFVSSCRHDAPEDDEDSEKGNQETEPSAVKGTLRATAAEAGTLLGTAVDAAELDDAEYVRILEEEFDYITPEDATKWGRLEPHDGTYRFDDADTIIAFAEDHGQSVKGHMKAGEWVSLTGYFGLGFDESPAAISLVVAGPQGDFCVASVGIHALGPE